MAGSSGLLVVSSQPSKTCSKSCVMKSELLSSRYTSSGVLHSMLFVAAIHVASFGADQFSFGTIDPPSSAIVEAILAWMSGHSEDGSELELEEEVEEAEEKTPLSVEREGDKRGEGGRMMPSARR